MPYESRKIIYDAAIKNYGKHMQQMVAIEEMSELIKELVKHSRGAENNTNIAEEIADVFIMLEQLMIMFDNEPLVRQYIEQKLFRLQFRMEGGELN